MSVPAKRRPKSKTRRNRAHLALSKVRLAKCSKCRKPVLSHHVCQNCGTYDGREAVKIKTKLEKNKKKEKEEKEEKESKKGE